MTSWTEPPAAPNVASSAAAETSWGRPSAPWKYRPVPATGGSPLAVASISLMSRPGAPGCDAPEVEPPWPLKWTTVGRSLRSSRSRASGSTAHRVTNSKRSRWPLRSSSAWMSWASRSRARRWVPAGLAARNRMVCFIGGNPDEATRPAISRQAPATCRDRGRFARRRPARGRRSEHDHAARVLARLEVGERLRRLVDLVAARDQLVELELAGGVEREHLREVLARARRAEVAAGQGLLLERQGAGHDGGRGAGRRDADRDGQAAAADRL